MLDETKRGSTNSVRISLFSFHAVFLLLLLLLLTTIFFFGGGGRVAVIRLALRLSKNSKLGLLAVFTEPDAYVGLPYHPIALATLGTLALTNAVLKVDCI